MKITSGGDDDILCSINIQTLCDICINQIITYFCFMRSSGSTKISIIQHEVGEVTLPGSISIILKSYSVSLFQVKNSNSFITISCVHKAISQVCTVVFCDLPATCVLKKETFFVSQPRFITYMCSGSVPVISLFNVLKNTTVPSAPMTSWMQWTKVFRVHDSERMTLHNLVFIRLCVREER